MEEMNVQQRWEEIRGSVARAAERAGRDPGEIEVLPVTKGHPPGAVEAALAAGFGAVGENRVGEAEEKRQRLRRRGLEEGRLRWHMVGHLQRNKALRAVHLFDVVESVDSLRLARKLQREAGEADRATLPVLVQVNCSGEEAKHGFAPGETVEAVGRILELPRLRVDGLMTMAPLTDDEGAIRSTFRRLRELRDRCRDEHDGFSGEVLSMGMSNDYELAVEEGSTRLRLGTALLGPRP